MPRLAPSLLRRAIAQNALLPRLLRECRDLHSADNELRWLTEFAQYDTKISCRGQNKTAYRQLRQYVERRSKGEPLQYILGSQPFGELDIQCRPGILIPRPETEVYTTELAQLIISAHQGGHLCEGRELTIADLCTGSGCISLLLHSLLRPPLHSPHLHGLVDRASAASIHGVDISFEALELAADNLRQNIALNTLHPCAKDDISFRQLDVLSLGKEAATRPSPLAANSATTDLASGNLSGPTSFLSQKWPVIVSNPPYISPEDYDPGGTTARSVRDYEPKLALVPLKTATDIFGGIPSVGATVQADVFYLALLYIARAVKTELLLMEVGDLKQATRVVELTQQVMLTPPLVNSMQGSPVVIETWRDDASVKSWDLVKPMPMGHGTNDSNSNTRAVVVWRGAAAKWRKAEMGR